MKILLMRHGKPMMPPTGWIAAAEMKTWIGDYDRAPVESGDVHLACIELGQGVSTVLTSTLPRAVSSAELLGISAFESDELFCEAGLPFAQWQFPRLPPELWAFLFRVCWLLGYSRQSESFAMAKIRARKAAEKLVSIAEKKGSVMLVGHGIMNHLIAKQLIEMGWSAPKKTQGTYWNIRTYTCKVLPKSVS